MGMMGAAGARCHKMAMAGSQGFASIFINGPGNEEHGGGGD